MIEMDNSLGSFIRGQLLISAIVGVLIAVGLSIIGVDFALIIGLIAGIFNIVPYFGPVYRGYSGSHFRASQIAVKRCLCCDPLYCR